MCPFFIPHTVSYMKTFGSFLKGYVVLLPILILASACAPQSTPTPFRPPTSIPPTQQLPTTTPIPSLFTPAPSPTIVSVEPAIKGSCFNDLTFIEDATVDDGTSFAPGAAIDKQWLVQNSGTCDWDDTYRLEFIGGDLLGTSDEQLLYPARAGAQGTLRIIFTAPGETGFYESAWQAAAPDGSFFGDPFNIKIVVE